MAKCVGHCIVMIYISTATHFKTEIRYSGTATHCDALQHTAMHCNTLRCTTTYREAKTHTMPYLYKSFSAKEPYN